MATTGRRGFTLLELMMVLLLCGVLAMGMGAVLRSSESLIGVNSVDMELQAEGERALNTLLTDLRETGRVDEGGGAVYPYFYTDGVAADFFAGYTHVPMTQHVGAGSPAFGPSTELVFKVPEDLDGDGKTTSSTDGSLEWSVAEYGYRLETGADGQNTLWRQVDGVNVLPICGYVERMVLEDQAADPALGPNHIRITLWLAKEDPDRPGYLAKRFFLSVINMRNVTGQGLIMGS